MLDCAYILDYALLAKRIREKKTMALVQGAWFITVSLLDSGNDLTNQTHRLQATNYTEADAAAADFVAALALVTDAKIAGYNVTTKWTENALTAFSDGTVRNSIVAQNSVSVLDQPLKKVSLVIPAPKAAVFAAVTGEGSDIVATGPTDLVPEFLPQFQTGGSVYISDGELVDTIPNLRGVRVSRYRRLA